MPSLFLSYFLIFFINLPVVLRKNFHLNSFSHNKSDYFTVLPFISLLVCFLIFFTFGWSLLLCLAFLVTFAILLLNMKDFYHFTIHLKKSADSVWTRTNGVIQTILLFGFIGVVIFFHPNFLKNTYEEKIVYTGSERAGYSVKENIFTKTAAKVNIYSQKKAPYNPAIVFISDIYTNVEDSKGTITYLVNRDFDVYAFTFYDDEIKYFGNSRDAYFFLPNMFRFEQKYYPNRIEEKHDKIQANLINEYCKADKMMAEFGIEKYYVVAEGNCIEAFETFIKNDEVASKHIKGFYAINRDDELSLYHDGYGNLQQLEPLEGILLGFEKDRKWDNAKKISFFVNKKFRG